MNFYFLLIELSLFMYALKLKIRKSENQRIENIFQTSLFSFFHRIINAKRLIYKPNMSIDQLIRLIRSSCWGSINQIRL